MFITTKFITVTERKQQSVFQKKITKEKVVYTGVLVKKKEQKFYVSQIQITPHKRK